MDQFLHRFHQLIARTVRGITAELEASRCRECVCAEYTESLREHKDILSDPAKRASSGTAAITTLVMFTICQQAAMYQFYTAIGMRVPAGDRVLKLPDYFSGGVLHSPGETVSFAELSEALEESQKLFDDPNYRATLTPEDTSELIAGIICVQAAMFEFYYTSGDEIPACASAEGLETD